MPFYRQCRLWAILETASGGTGLFFADWLKKCSSLKCVYHEVIRVISWMLGEEHAQSHTLISAECHGQWQQPPESRPPPCSLSPCHLFFRHHWLIVPWVEQRRSSHRATVFLIWAPSSLELSPLKEDGDCCLWTELFALRRPDEHTARVD